MDEVKKYWRDAVMKLLGWGTGSLLVVVGWSIKESGQFELGPLAGGTLDPGNVLRAIGLLIFASAFGLSWYLAVRWIYRRHLSEQTDATVLGWVFVRTYLLVVITLLWTVSAIVALL